MNSGQSFAGPLFFSVLFIFILLLIKGCEEENAGSFLKNNYYGSPASIEHSKNNNNKQSN